MTSTSRGLAGTLLPVGLLLIAMASIQSGASLAKSMFPLVGAQGTTALRLFFAALILLLLLRPWRKRLSLQSLRSVVVYGIALGGMNLLFYLSVRTVPLGIAVALEFTGPLLVAILSSRRLLDFLWIGLAVFGIWLLLPLGNSAEPLAGGLRPRAALARLPARRPGQSAPACGAVRRWRAGPRSPGIGRSAPRR